MSLHAPMEYDLGKQVGLWKLMRRDTTAWKTNKRKDILIVRNTWEFCLEDSKGKTMISRKKKRWIWRKSLDLNINGTGPSGALVQVNHTSWRLFCTIWEKKLGTLKKCLLCSWSYMIKLETCFKNVYSFIYNSQGQFNITWLNNGSNLKFSSSNCVFSVCFFSANHIRWLQQWNTTMRKEKR